jgi:protein-tyrosine phosphatase
MVNQSQPPIPEAYWVRPGRLLAGEYPRSVANEASRLKLRHLLAAGVAFFLDLTEAGEHGLKPYVALLRQEAAALGRQVEHRRMSIPDMGVPSPAQMKRILGVIDEQLAAGEVVYVHCFGGIGRTGVVVGCYLVRHGMNGDEALARIAQLRAGTPDGASPETAAQRRMVREWGEREKEGAESIAADD